MRIIDVRDKLPTHDNKQYYKRPLNAMYYLAIHHSLSDNLPGDGDVFAFADYHINDKDWPGIGYHYVIDVDGTIYKCHDADIKTYHVGQHNRASLGICLVGDFRDNKPPAAQYQAALELVKQCVDAYQITINNIKGHSEFPGYEWKHCPEIDMKKFREEVRNFGK